MREQVEAVVQCIVQMYNTAKTCTREVQTIFHGHLCTAHILIVRISNTWPVSRRRPGAGFGSR